jgi:predicted lactoylglutathione lyase
MKNNFIISLALLSAFGLGILTMSFVYQEGKEKKTTEKPLILGAFSISLNVKDLQKSKAFYEQLGFSKMGGDEKNNYLILKNGTTIIGIFKGFFEGNMLTFNPGWDSNAKNMKKWDDVRVIQQHLKDAGVSLLTEVDSTAKTGPEFIMLQDPDGNMLLFDQHR